MKINRNTILVILATAAITMSLRDELEDLPVFGDIPKLKFR